MYCLTSIGGAKSYIGHVKNHRECIDKILLRHKKKHKMLTVIKENN